MTQAHILPVKQKFNRIDERSVANNLDFYPTMEPHIHKPPLQHSGRAIPEDPASRAGVHLVKRHCNHLEDRVVSEKGREEALLSRKEVLQTCNSSHPWQRRVCFEHRDRALPPDIGISCRTSRLLRFRREKACLSGGPRRSIRRRHCSFRTLLP